MARPGYLGDFILETEPVTPVTEDGLDLYLPGSVEPAPLVVLVHGMAQERPEVAPRDWPVFRGYAGQLARRGVAAAMFDHELLDGLHFPQALRTLLAAVDRARGHDAVDAGRVAVWAFSGGGPLLFPVMAGAQPWLSCVAASYPLLPHEPIEEWPAAGEALAGLGGRPFVLTTVEHEVAPLLPGQEHFLGAARSAGTDLRHLEVRDAAHAFDALEPTEQGRVAVTAALDEVAEALDA